MKKLLALVVCLVFIASSCCAYTDATGKTTKNFVNCLSKAQQYTCNPTDAQKATAQAILTFISTGASFAVPLLVNGVVVTPEQVSSVLNLIVAGACVGITDLMNVLQWYQEISSKPSTQMYLTKTARTAPSAAPLYEMVKKK